MGTYGNAIAEGDRDNDESGEDKKWSYCSFRVSVFLIFQ